MKTWEDWSDREIDSSVASVVFDCKGWSKTKSFNVLYIELNEGKEIKVQSVPRYCNNPTDMWPIIFDNGICLTSATKGRKSSLWSASWNEDGGKWSSGDIVFGDKNPLRAAAIVFLMMNGVTPE